MTDKILADRTRRQVIAWSAQTHFDIPLEATELALHVVSIVVVLALRLDGQHIVRPHGDLHAASIFRPPEGMHGQTALIYGKQAAVRRPEHQAPAFSKHSAGVRRHSQATLT